MPAIMEATAMRYHSTISNSNYIKSLGLGRSNADGNFHDLDDVMVESGFVCTWV